MSLVQTLKQKEEAVAALELAMAEKAKEMEALAAQIADKDAQIAQHAAIIAKLEEDAQAAFEATAKAIQAEQDKAKAMAADLDKARHALANPAFTDAAAKGEAKAPTGDAIKESGQSPEQFMAAYNAEKDPAKRAAMWRALNS